MTTDGGKCWNNISNKIKIFLREIEEINVHCVNEAQVIMICFCVKKS